MTIPLQSVSPAPLRLPLLALLAGTLLACQSPPSPSQRTAAPGGSLPDPPKSIDPDTLERLNRAFADRYVMRLSTVCDLILKGNTDTAQCHFIRETRATSAMSVYDIVTEPGPRIQTLNLMIVVTLQYVAWDEGGYAKQVFGDRAGIVIDALKAAHAEVRELAGECFSPADLVVLDGLIRQWHKKNPDLHRLSSARIAHFIDAAEQDSSSRQQARGLFAQIEEARQSVDEVRALAQRALYLSKRMPVLLSWRVEATSDDLMSNPQLVQALADFHTLAQTADRLPVTLDAQRKAILQDFDQRQPAIDATVKNIRETIAQGATFSNDTRSLLVELQKTSTSLQALFKEWDNLSDRYMPPRQASPPLAPPPLAAAAPPVPQALALAVPPPAIPPSLPATSSPAPASVAAAPAPAPGPRPFDIQDYTVAIKEAAVMSRELNAALVSSERLVDSPAWKQRIDDLNTIADGRVRLAADQSQILVNSTFQKVYIALAVFLLGLTFCRLLTAWIIKKWNK